MTLKAEANRLLYSLDPRLPRRAFHQKERYINRLFFNGNPEKIKIISLGNSYSYININFAQSPVPALHLSNTGEDIFETRYKYAYYIQFLPNLRYILMPIYPYLLFFDNSYHSKKRFEHRTCIYHAIEGDGAIGGDELHKGITRIFKKIVRDPEIELLKIEFGVDQTNTLVDDSMDKVWNRNALDDAATTKVLPALESMVHKMNANRPNLYEKCCQCMTSIMEDATRRNIRIILISTPMYCTFINNYSKTHLEMTQHFVKIIQQRYPNVNVRTCQY